MISEMIQKNRFLVGILGSVVVLMSFGRCSPIHPNLSKNYEQKTPEFSSPPVSRKTIHIFRQASRVLDAKEQNDFSMVDAKIANLKPQTTLVLSDTADGRLREQFQEFKFSGKTEIDLSALPLPDCAHVHFRISSHPVLGKFSSMDGSLDFQVSLSGAPDAMELSYFEAELRPKEGAVWVLQISSSVKKELSQFVRDRLESITVLLNSETSI